MRFSVSRVAAPSGRPPAACGVMITSPQALTTPVAVVPPDASEVPKLTPNTDKYDALCEDLATPTLPDGLTVTCNGDEPLTVSLAPAP